MQTLRIYTGLLMSVHEYVCMYMYTCKGFILLYFQRYCKCMEILCAYRAGAFVLAHLCMQLDRFVCGYLHTCRCCKDTHVFILCLLILFPCVGVVGQEMGRSDGQTVRGCKKTDWICIYSMLYKRL